MSEAIEKVGRELAASGVLKVGLNLANFLLVSQGDGPVREGVAPDMARELARQLGLAVEFVPYSSPGAMADAARTGDWDIAFLAVELERQAEIEFTAPYLEVDATYLVPAGSGMVHVDQVDREGVRIAVVQNSAYDLVLRRSIRLAKLVHASSADAAFHEFEMQGLEALSGLRPRLAQQQAKWKGSKVLPGRFAAIGQAIGVPKKQAASAAFLSRFVETCKTSGLVARLIERPRVEGVAVSLPKA